MKTKIFITIIFLISLLSINIASADTCSFLDSNGDCITTVSELNDVEALASLKTINCYWSNCQLTLDVNGDGFITSSDISLIKSIVQLKQTTIDGAPSIINLELINNNTQIRLTVTDSDGTVRSDIGVNVAVNEYPGTYDGVVITDTNGESIIGIPSELLTQSWTGKVWFDDDAQKQIPYTENTVIYTYTAPQETQAPPSSSDGGSGGSGGGSSTPTCIDEHFECSEWNECTGNKVQTRSCKEIKNCKGDYEPSKLQSCTPKVEPKPVEITNQENEVKETEQESNNQITGAVIYENPVWSAKVRAFFVSIINWFISLF